MTRYNFIIGFVPSQRSDYLQVVEEMRANNSESGPLIPPVDNIPHFDEGVCSMVQQEIDCSIRRKDSLVDLIRSRGLAVVVSDKVQSEEEMRRRAQRFYRISHL